MTGTIKLDADLLAGIKKFIEDRDIPPSPQMDPNGAVNVIVRDWLQGQGYIPLPAGPDEITPALEAAEVPGS